MKMKVKSRKKLHVRKGDTAIVIAGNDKGKKGKILEVIREKTLPGIQALAKVAHINPEEITSENIAFQIASRFSVVAVGAPKRFAYDLIDHSKALQITCR